MFVLVVLAVMNVAVLGALCVLSRRLKDSLDEFVLIYMRGHEEPVVKPWRAEVLDLENLDYRDLVYADADVDLEIEAPQSSR